MILVFYILSNFIKIKKDFFSVDIEKLPNLLVDSFGNGDHLRLQLSPAG